MSNNKQTLSKLNFVWQLSLILTLSLHIKFVLAENQDNLNPLSDVPEIVTDAEMSEMRGRFIRQGRPIYFGIYMQSQWSSGGTSMNVGMNIGINLRKDIATENRVTIGVQLEDVTESSNLPEILVASNSPSSDIDIGGLDNAQGVTQAITVAGDNNQAHNKTFMTLQLASPNQAESEAQGNNIYYFGGQNLSTRPLSTDISGTTSQTNSNGVVSTAFIDETGVGIKIDVPEQGSAMQLLRGKNNNREGSGIFQTIQIEGGNANSVTNQLNFIAEFSPVNSDSHLISIQPAFESLKAIQGIGIQ